VVTPSNSAALGYITKRLWVGGTGDVKVDTAGGDLGVIFSSIPAGAYLVGAFTKVYATGTTATLITAQY
jgi:hypothetical protein